MNERVVSRSDQLPRQLDTFLKTHRAEVVVKAIMHVFHVSFIESIGNHRFPVPSLDTVKLLWIDSLLNEVNNLSIQRIYPRTQGSTYPLFS